MTEDLEYSGLMYPNLEWKNASGDVILKLKRKEDWGPVYYVFEKNLEFLSDEERTRFDADWDFISMVAGKAGFKLFDSAEIMEAVHAQLKAVLESEDGKRAMAEADETGEITLVRDIDIRLYDHGTRRITSLTIGISVPSGASENIKGMREVLKKFAED